MRVAPAVLRRLVPTVRVSEITRFLLPAIVSLLRIILRFAAPLTRSLGRHHGCRNPGQRLFLTVESQSRLPVGARGLVALAIGVASKGIRGVSRQLATLKIVAPERAMPIDGIVLKRVHIVNAIARLEAQSLARLQAWALEVPITRDEQARVRLQVLLVGYCLQLLQVHGGDFADGVFLSRLLGS